MSRIKILHVHGGLMLYGGTEAFIMNVLRYIDKEKFEIELLIHGDGVGIYDQEINDLGIRIINAPIMSKDPIEYKKSIHKILTDGNYDTVHSHLNSMNTPILKAAKQLGIHTRISHAHASEYYSTNKIKNLVNAYNKRRIHKYATDLFSCSIVAGDFTYGKHPFKLWYNAIDLDKYSYNKNNRDKIRKLHDIEGKVVYLNVGRFNFQKNHLFLIDIFKEIVELDSNATLLLVGTGELEQSVKEYVVEKELQENVIFVGVVDNVHEYLSAADHFLLPSLFEGLPYVLVEAQATGLQVFSADTVAPETKIINDFYFLPIDSSLKWKEAIEENHNYERYSRTQELMNAGFEVKSTIDKLENYYVSHYIGEGK